MKRTILGLAFLSILALSSPAFAGISVCDDGNGKVASFSLRGNPIEGCEYYDNGQNISEAQDTALMTLLKTVPQRYLKMINGFPAEMSPQEKVDVDDAWAAEIEQKDIERIDSGEITGKELLKAVAAVISDSASYKEITEEVIIDKIKEQREIKK